MMMHWGKQSHPLQIPGGPLGSFPFQCIPRSASTFSFSVIAQEDSFSTGVIAMFKIKPTESVIASGDKLITTQLSFITGDGGSAVLERETGANILQKSEAIKFDLVAE